MIMKPSVLVAIILILTILPSCSSEAPVPLSPAPEETQASTQLPTLEETPAEFTISGLSVTPIEVKTNEEITISAEVTNSGGSEGSYVVILKINGVEESREAITIEAGKSETIHFSVPRDKDGSYEVSIDDKVGQFTVSTPIPAYIPPATTPPPTPTKPYTGPLFDTHLHTRNILQPQSAETLLSYLDREKVDWAICFCAFPSNWSSFMPIVRSIGSRVVMLSGVSRMLTGQFSEATLRQQLQPQGPLWGFGGRSFRV